MVRQRGHYGSSRKQSGIARYDAPQSFRGNNGKVNAFRDGVYKSAVIAACDYYEKQQEFKAQHGPVRVLFKDGKPVEP
jgi:hypothetical protein